MNTTKKIIALTLALTLSLISKEVSAQSNQCSQSGNQACCLEYTGAINAAEADWLANLNQLKDQEKPASEMVDEAYENLRTYNCWLDYICRGVQYSGYAPIESALDTGLTSQHIGQSPGCQLPEDLKMEENYGTFTEKLKDVPVFGTPIVNKEELYQKEKINFFPSCMTDPKFNNQNPLISEINDNFLGCKAAIELKFGCNDPELLKDKKKFQECMQESKAMIVVENTLKNVNADQRATALETKLADIVKKLHTMEANVTTMANFLIQLDQRLACLTRQCT